MFTGDERLFCRGHTADGRTILVPAFGVTGTDALDPGDSFGFPAVALAYDMPSIGAGGRKHPLKLHAGQNVLIPVKTIFSLKFRIIFFKSRCQDNGTDIQSYHFFLHAVHNSLFIAGGNTLHTFGTHGAIQATFGFRQRVVLGESGFNLVKIAGPQLCRKFRCLCPFFLFGMRRGRKEFFRDGLQHFVKTINPKVLPLEIAFHRFHGPFSCGDGLDDAGRTGSVISSGKNTFNRCFKRDGVRFETTTLDIDTDVSKQFAVDGLTNRHDDLIRVDIF